MSTKSDSSPIQSKAPLNKRVKPVRPSKYISIKVIRKSFIFLSRTLPTTGLRTYNDIVNSGAYTQPDYHPKPMSMLNMKLNL